MSTTLSFASLSAAATSFGKGECTQAEVLSWLLATEWDMGEVMSLFALGFDQPTVATIMANRKKQIESKVKGAQMGAMSIRISAKGAISVYGLSAKWPITLYAQQWERFLRSQGCAIEGDKIEVIIESVGADGKSTFRTEERDCVKGSSILALCDNPEASESYCLADYMFNKSGKSYSSELIGKEGSQERKTALAFAMEVAEGKHPSHICNAVAIEHVSHAMKFGGSDGLRDKCVAHPVFVKVSRK